MSVVVRNLTDLDIEFADHPGKLLRLDEPDASKAANFVWLVNYSGPGPIDFQTRVGAGRELSIRPDGLFGWNDAVPFPVQQQDRDGDLIELASR